MVVIFKAAIVLSLLFSGAVSAKRLRARTTTRLTRRAIDNAAHARATTLYTQASEKNNPSADGLRLMLEAIASHMTYIQSVVTDSTFEPRPGMEKYKIKDHVRQLTVLKDHYTKQKALFEKAKSLAGKGQREQQASALAGYYADEAGLMARASMNDFELFGAACNEACKKLNVEFSAARDKNGSLVYVAPKSDKAWTSDLLSNPAYAPAIRFAKMQPKQF